jgi:hypothetical protein
MRRQRRRSLPADEGAELAGDSLRGAWVVVGHDGDVVALTGIDVELGVDPGEADAVADDSLAVDHFLLEAIGVFLAGKRLHNSNR